MDKDGREIPSANYRFSRLPVSNKCIDNSHFLSSLDYKQPAVQVGCNGVLESDTDRRAARTTLYKLPKSLIFASWPRKLTDSIWNFRRIFIHSRDRATSGLEDRRLEIRCRSMSDNVGLSFSDLGDLENL